MELIVKGENAAYVVLCLKNALAAVNLRYADNVRLVESNQDYSGAPPSGRDTRTGCRVRFALRCKDLTRPGHRVHFRAHDIEWYDALPIVSEWRRKRSRFACWHVHRDFLRELFNLLPAAVVRSGSRHVRGGPIIYQGLAGFEANYVDADVQVAGTDWEPIYFSESCDCAGEEHSHY